ncbi:MAG: hypothetical protein MK207_05875 [Saprospiraceae bacterium]|nr:hypothetical protein [Saprospiraceae bacterium]
MKKLHLSIYLILCSFLVNAQEATSINEDGSTADSSAILDVKSADQGVLIPRMSQSQRNAITNPAVGLLIFQLDNPAGFYYYNGSNWVALGNTISNHNIEIWACADDQIHEFYIDGIPVTTNNFPSSWLHPSTGTISGTIYYNTTVPYSTTLSTGNHIIAFKVRDNAVCKAFMAAIVNSGAAVVTTGNGQFKTTTTNPGSNWYTDTFNDSGWTVDNTACTYIHSNWDSGTPGFPTISNAYPSAKRIWEGNNCAPPFNGSIADLWIRVSFTLP